MSEWKHPYRQKNDACIKKHVGARNEMVACTWLLNQGYEVFRNVSPVGEIDVIAKRGDELLLLDVKGIHLNVDGYASATSNRLTPEQVAAGVKRLNVFSDGTCELIDNVVAIGVPLHERPCKRCQKMFAPLRETARYCSNVCSVETRRDKQREVRNAQ